MQNKVNTMFQILSNIFIILSNIFMIPFIFWILTLPFVTFGHIYEGAKIFVFWVGSFLLILYWLIKKRAEFIKVLNKWDVWYWIWILLLVTSSIFGIDPMKSIIGGGTDIKESFFSLPCG